ncbi:hypothetical protein ACHHV8_11175 [Paenibacillus sp. TAB 01]|uniref:hypothetical protein n=1 Tax=Paenibacillus sp. TAB 01 TaxID=3368988 RepID=UPI0037533916
MFNAVTIAFADTFLSALPEGSKWLGVSDEDKEKYIRAAVMDFADVLFYDDYFVEGVAVPEKIKWAICYQALYILLDPNRIENEIRKKNGLKSEELKLDKITDKTTYGGADKRSLYPKAYNLTKDFMILSADWW